MSSQRSGVRTYHRPPRLVGCRKKRDVSKKGGRVETVRWLRSASDGVRRGDGGGGVVVISVPPATGVSPPFGTDGMGVMARGEESLELQLRTMHLAESEAAVAADTLLQHVAHDLCRQCSLADVVRTTTTSSSSSSGSSSSPSGDTVSSSSEEEETIGLGDMAALKEATSELVAAEKAAAAAEMALAMDIEGEKLATLLSRSELLNEPRFLPYIR